MEVWDIGIYSTESLMAGILLKLYMPPECIDVHMIFSYFYIAILTYTPFSFGNM